ncbi:MAG: hypothetical protein MUC77_00585 [Chromatiaceae bacterium]|jgi:hypothetical protein|nr:hypothetical protein [Chromatiaceae bacterium]
MRPLGSPDTWGPASIALRLPVCGIAIEGLSARQRDEVARNHPSFLAAEGALHGTAGIVCQAGRLPEPLSIPAEELTCAGQYAPRQVRRGGGLEVTGINFTAWVPLDAAADARTPAAARLCVAREEELPQPMVLENFLRILLAHRALGFGGMLLHSAGLVVDGRALLFVGRSNAGKTTLSRKADAAGARVLSDDINLVLPAADGYAVHSVPFTGEFRRRVALEPGAVPLAGILLLEKGPRLTLAPVGAAAAVSALFAQCPFVNTGAEEAPGLLDSLARLVTATPVARLTVALDDPFTTIIDRAQGAFAHV